ncbi:MAG: cupredoxin domain-containing protein [Nitrososphaerales archaeon]|jgi:FtsP/CotA-like multicopper oxidase with cupredoxin domain
MNRPTRNTLVLATATVVAFAAVAGVLGLGALYGDRATGGSVTTGEVVLPSGCVRPANGFLVLQSEYGYNDSIVQGAGLSKPWPVITVQEGQTVSIEVCNVGDEAHGFQIQDYVDGKINVVAPGEVVNFTFVAAKAGNFQIYCAIPCEIHFFMQFGQLRVVA